MGLDASMNELWGGAVPRRHSNDMEPYSDPWQVQAVAAAREKAGVTLDDPRNPFARGGAKVVSTPAVTKSLESQFSRFTTPK